MRIGIGIGDIGGTPGTIDGLVAQARQAEADGFASGWFANIFGMDAMMAAAICGRETSRIELGTAGVPAHPGPPPGVGAAPPPAPPPPPRRFAPRTGRPRR